MVEQKPKLFMKVYVVGTKVISDNAILFDMKKNVSLNQNLNFVGNI